MSQPPLLRIYTDGASRGNPGAAAFAYVIQPEGGAPLEEAGCLGETTNNQAEYTALVRALEHALELGPRHRLFIHSDSELLVKQMNGEYRVKNEELRGLYRDALALTKRFEGGVTIRHVRRAENSRADALCNEALDGKRGKSAGRGKVAPPSAATLRDQALERLRAAAAAWKGHADEPTPERLWDSLVAVLEAHGVRVPSGPA